MRSVIAAIGVLLVTTSPSVQSTNLNSGQIGKRFQMFYSPIKRADTFLVDTKVGKVWQQVEDSITKEPFFKTVPKLEETDIYADLVNEAEGAPGRFQIVFSPHVVADTYLLDTTSGKTWGVVQTKDGSLALERRKMR